MSTEARAEFEAAREGQLIKNDARRIRMRVAEARKSPEMAGPRWPFELLQNALDAGAREGREAVHVSITWHGDDLVFEHDGAPFEFAELAALLSGGSSKEFDSEETTGRFGTGFLSAHVLSTNVAVRGLLATVRGREVFKLRLQRGGDEASISENIQTSSDAIAEATSISDDEEMPSGSFTYLAANADAVRSGLAAFRQALPFVFMTCPKLGRVSITESNGTEEWSATPAADVAPYGSERYVSCTGAATAKVRALRFATAEAPKVSILVLAERSASEWSVLTPPHDAPRLFCRFPVRPSHYLPINVAVDAPFELAQERNRILHTDENLGLIRSAFAALPQALRCAYAETWNAAHRLARVGPVSEGEGLGGDALQWWRAPLSELAHALSKLTLVATRQGFGSAVSINEPDWFADFLKPYFDRDEPWDALAVQRFWTVMNQVDKYIPPNLSLAAEWSGIAREWSALGVEVNRIDLAELAAAVLPDSERLEDLLVTGEKVEWLARFVDLVGEASKAGAPIGPDILDGLLPDQDGVLHFRKDLRRESAIPEELKDIATDIGFGVRSVLVDLRLGEAAQRHELRNFASAIENAIPLVLSELDVIEECLKRLAASLKAGEQLADKDTQLVRASVRLLEYLWRTRQVDAAELARRCPCVASDATINAWSKDRMLMAPIQSWHSDAVPFSAAYPPSRILAPLYDDGSVCPSVVAGLVAWGIAHADPLITVKVGEVKDRRLKALVVGDSDVGAATVSDLEMSQIALLHPDIFNRCSESPERSQQLLGLVLCHIARNDSRWRAIQPVRARAKAMEFDISLRPAQWVADLKLRSWVPARIDDEKYSDGPATPATLLPLLRPEWLSGNDAAISLLTECFGFDALELRLLGAAPNEEQRREVRDALARLVEQSGADTEAIDAVVKALEDSRKKAALVGRLQTFGLAIQAVIEQILRDEGLRVTLIDRGFDFDVRVDGAMDLEQRFEISGWLLEVKATTSGEVRLTPLQAATAAREQARFALCVVDLRGAMDTLDREWAAEDVAPYAKVLSNVGVSVATPWSLVQAACASEVSIRNEDGLRYAVPTALWSEGESLSSWIARISAPETGAQISADAAFSDQRQEGERDGLTGSATVREQPDERG